MEKKIEKIHHNSSSNLKVIAVFSVWFSVFFFILVVSTESTYLSSRVNNLLNTNNTEVLSQKEVLLINQKIVKFEETDTENISTPVPIIFPVEVTIPPPSVLPAPLSSPTPIENSNRIKNKFIVLREVVENAPIITTVPIQSPITQEEKASTQPDISRRKNTSENILPKRIVISKIGVDTTIENPK